MREPSGSLGRGGKRYNNIISVSEVLKDSLSYCFKVGDNVNTSGGNRVGAGLG